MIYMPFAIARRRAMRALLREVLAWLWILAPLPLLALAAYLSLEVSYLRDVHTIVHRQQSTQVEPWEVIRVNR